MHRLIDTLTPPTKMLAERGVQFGDLPTWYATGIVLLPGRSVLSRISERVREAAS